MPEEDDIVGEDLARFQRTAQERVIIAQRAAGKAFTSINISSAESWSQHHKDRVSAQLRTFEEEGGLRIKKVREADLRDMSLQYDAAIAAKSEMPSLIEKSASISTPIASPDEKKAILEKGGEILAGCWPLFALLSLLEDPAKAEALRQAAIKSQKHTISLTASEYAQLQSSLAQGKKL